MSGVAKAAVDADFIPDVDGSVNTIVPQLDGKLVIAGVFSNAGGLVRNRVARLNSDGTLDAGFNANDAIPNLFNASALVLQDNGKILSGGSLSVDGVLGIARLNVDGSLDTDFNSNVLADLTSGGVRSLATQADSKILVGGGFSATQIDQLVRLNPDGSLDAGFNANVVGAIFTAVNTIVPLADGRILIGGGFNSVGGIARNRIARLNADGSLDASFNVDVDNTVFTIVLQADGKILLGGSFSNGGGVARSRIARLNIDGSLDTSFAPDANNVVFTIVPQVDGKILLGGVFTSIGGVTRNRAARLNADGSLDSSFNPNVSTGSVSTLIPQADGKILLAGAFTEVEGQARNRIARLNASGDIPNEDVIVRTTVGGSLVSWFRGGGAIELRATTLEISFDEGATWSSPIQGRRISGGWSFSNENLDEGEHLLRFRGTATAGINNGSTFTIESILVAPPPTAFEPSDVEFCTPITTSSGAVAVICL